MTSVCVAVQTLDQAAEARRAAAALASQAAFGETDAGRIAIVVTEAATNIARHAGSGQIVMRAMEGESPVFEMLALDKGPGMGDVNRCFRDGYSTAGSAGTGLGAIQRLSSEWDVFTAEGRGTVLLARIRGKAPHARISAFKNCEIGIVSVPMRGETVCGDGWAVAESFGTVTLMMVDGLGHGYLAAQSALAAVSAFHDGPVPGALDLLKKLHGAMSSTRGGALSVAQLEPAAGVVRYAGVGNVSGIVGTPGNERHMVSAPGIAGHNIRHVREYTYNWRPGDLLLLYSDGIATHWSLDPYAPVTARDPALLAGLVYRDWDRERDDASVAVLKVNG